MSAPTPSQAICIQETFGIPSAVVAGAGSGKTDTLTRRIVYALEHPELSGAADIDNILAITYTNKAAAELRSRIKAALIQASTPENGLGLQALKVDGAWISTIHSMCARILKENALAFGVDPAFAVAVDEVRDQLIDAALEATLQHAVLADAESDEAQLLGEYRRDKIKSMLSELVTQALDAPTSELSDVFALMPASSPIESFLNLVALVQQLLRIVEEKQVNDEKVGKRDLDFYEAAHAAVAELLGVPETDNLSSAVVSFERLEQLCAMRPEQLLALADAVPVLHGSAALAKLVPEGLDAPAKSALERAAAELRLGVGTRLLPVLIRLVDQALTAYEELKQQQGLLDNSDLLRLVAAALTDPANTSIAQRYADQFTLVMVDEFQDTNQMQVDMINLVAGGVAGEPSEKLCVVGDAQQSIYRFRNADLAVFQQHVRRVRESAQGRVIELGDNFRSHDDILSFVRGVFSRVFEQDFLDLHHGRDEARAAKAAPYFGAEQGEDASLPRRVNVKVFGKKGVRGYSERAAEAIAEDFDALIARGNRPGEMAVLLGKMTHADAYAAALQRRGIKCAITGGTVFKGSDDVQIVAHLCAALANPLDSEALVDVLTSDLFCLEAADLLQLVSLREGVRGAVGDIFTLLARDEDETVESLFHAAGLGTPSPQLRAAVEVFGAAVGQVGARRISALVEDVLADSGWLARLEADDTPRAANVFKAVRILRAIEDESGAGARRVAERFRARLQVAKEAPGVLSAKGDDFVRIMTVHASKGLSIPIVAVAETDYRPAKRDKLITVQAGNRTYVALDAGASIYGLSPKGLVASSLKSLAGGGKLLTSEDEARQVLDAITHERGLSQCAAAEFYAALQLLDYAADIEEHQRKLYVAYTRAKEALITTQGTFASKPKQRVNGGMQAGEAIAELLVGDVADPLFTKPGEFAQQVIALPQLDGAPAGTLWEARLQVYPADDQAGAFEEVQDATETDEAHEGAKAPTEPACAGASEEAAVGGYPQGELLLYGKERPTRAIQNEQPYRAQWAQGILSASSLKADAADAEQDAESERLQVEAAGDKALNSADGSFASELGWGNEPFDVPSEQVQLAFGEDDDPPAPATDRGTAFHALCEWAAHHRNDEGTFAVPPLARQQAMARLYGLNARQEAELPRILERWLASPQATFAAAHRHVHPEFPFWVPLEVATSEGNSLVLEGFIDLLAFDEPNQGSAYVIDYKTGTGHNTDAKRRAAYGLQAACYAYALMMQGFSDVQLDFVFVDQPDSDQPDLPTVVRFPGEDEPPYDLASLHELISKQAQ